MEPSKAGASLRPLIDHAKEHVPKELYAKTPIFLMATAGLRMVGDAAKDAILASVCAELSASGFMFKCEWATLLDGQDEGLYGWVTVNYLLDRLYPPAAEPPVGIIDLGGGSVQIVFAPPRAALRSSLPDGVSTTRRTVLRVVRVLCSPLSLLLFLFGGSSLLLTPRARTLRLLQDALFRRARAQHVHQVAPRLRA